jgi:hypothetical protein
VPNLLLKNNFFSFFGGLYANSPPDSLWRYSLDTETWKKASLPAAQLVPTVDEKWFTVGSSGSAENSLTTDQKQEQGDQ